MATPGSLFSQTLQDITNTKLEELAKKRKTFEEQRLALVTKAESEQDAVQMLVMLADGVKSCFAVAAHEGRVVRGSTNNPRLEIDLKNLDRFLKQARYDPSVSSRVLEQWQQSLLRHLDIQSLKFSFASLYGNLTTEWLQSKQAAPLAVGEDTEMEDFEHVPGGKKLESRSRWERAVFEPAEVDKAAVEQLLKETFDTSSEDPKQLKKALKALREKVQDFERSLASPGNFDQHTLDWAIRGLLASDLLIDGKRAVLKDFLNNSMILSEVSDVLNMRMAALGSWSWGDEVQLEERRQLNGSFNIYMHEDLLQAIFLQYIGVKWSVFWKHAFSDLRKFKGVWKSPRTSIPLIDRKRRDYYLGPLPDRPSVQSKKQKIYRQSYFLSQLMDSETQQIVTEEGDEEADLDEDYGTADPGQYYASQTTQAQTSGRTKQTARKSPGGMAPRKQTARKSSGGMAPRKQFATRAALKAGPPIVFYNSYAVDEGDGDSEFEDDANANEPKNPMDAKQSLLHLLSTEILIKTRLHGEITCFRSQLDNFYPSLPHSTIQSVLQFFGVSGKWLQFFERFLQAPLRFMDDKDAEPRLRKRGTPGSHALSEVFGEVVLFCLDYKVNQTAEGEPLWRLHDDFWFWSSNLDRCAKSWTTITAFTKTMGLSLNEARTGSARMLQKNEGIVAAEVKKPLPQGQIRWGMLYLNPETGRFEIDQNMVDKHVDELGRQLEDKSKSVFAWIQAWNTYATTFFTSNFGKAANCFGREHVDNMLATHERIQHNIFSSATEAAGKESGSVVAYLKKTIEQRFGNKDIPDAYFFFPVELGGLEVQSPFIQLLQIRDMVTDLPHKLLDDFVEAEKEAYKTAKLHYESRGTTETHGETNDPHFKPQNPNDFMPFAEYIKYREELNYGFQDELVDVFDRLLRRPDEESIDCDDNGQVKIALNALGMQSGLRGILPDFYSMEPYWKWVAQLYGPEMIERFGGFNIVDPGLLPIGMVSLFRSGRVKWQE